MNKSTRNLRQSPWAILLFAAMIVGCSTFRGTGKYSGPGELVGPDLQEEDEDYQGTPSVTLNGSRITDTENQAEVAFDWPVDQARLSRGFSLGKRPHWGLDLAAAKGTQILAAEKGTVIYTGRGFRGYGNLILIEHNGAWASLYSHLSKIVVKEGQEVSRGDLIGLMGATGNARGVHLHFEIRQNRQPVNPLAFLPQGVINTGVVSEAEDEDPNWPYTISRQPAAGVSQ